MFSRFKKENGLQWVESDTLFISLQHDKIKIPSSTLKRAKAGNINACFAISDTYYKRSAITLDTDDRQKAFQWILRAMQQDTKNSAAMVRLSHYYIDGCGVSQDLNKAKLYSEKAALLGDKEGEFNIGYLLRGEDAAEDWFLKSAAQKYLPAMNHLGYIYETKYNDYNEALNWYKKAYKYGCEMAPFNIAKMYVDGIGVDKDYKMALKWTSRSVACGYKEANYLLGVLYFERDDHKKALACFKKISEWHVLSQCCLGHMYYYGFGTEKSPTLAKQWYSRAAEQEEVEAMWSMGNIYRLGFGVPIDYELALEWYQKSADKEHAIAACEMASMYEQGLGVKMDRYKALYWYQKSADRGWDKAKEKVEMLNEEMDHLENQDLEKNIKVNTGEIVTSINEDTKVKYQNEHVNRESELSHTSDKKTFEKLHQDQREILDKMETLMVWSMKNSAVSDKTKNKNKSKVSEKDDPLNDIYFDSGDED